MSEHRAIQELLGKKITNPTHRDYHKEFICLISRYFSDNTTGMIARDYHLIIHSPSVMKTIREDNNTQLTISSYIKNIITKSNNKKKSEYLSLMNDMVNYFDYYNMEMSKSNYNNYLKNNYKFICTINDYHKYLNNPEFQQLLWDYFKLLSLDNNNEFIQEEIIRLKSLIDSSIENAGFNRKLNYEKEKAEREYLDSVPIIEEDKDSIVLKNSISRNL